MITDKSKLLIESIDLLESIIKKDIEDLKSGNSDNLITRNEQKQTLVNKIQQTKHDLDNSLMALYNNGNDIEPYRSLIDNVEHKLHQLNKTNNELAYILLPLKDMYDNIIGDFFKENQSSINYSA